MEVCLVEGGPMSPRQRRMSRDVTDPTPTAADATNDETPASEIGIDPDLVGPFAPSSVPTAPPATTHVEITGVGLRVRGYMRQTHGGRFSDQVNLAQRSLHLYEASLVDRQGHTHAILSEDLFITRRQIVLISELRTGRVNSDPEQYVQKGVRPIVAVAPAFVITGSLHLVPNASADIYFESDDPHFIPLTGVRVRWRLDDSQVSYDFALLNRQQISAIGLRPMGAADPDAD
jgi:hypothetical protein